MASSSSSCLLAAQPRYAAVSRPGTSGNAAIRSRRTAHRADRYRESPGASSATGSLSQSVNGAERPVSKAFGGSGGPPASAAMTAVR